MSDSRLVSPSLDDFLGIRFHPGHVRLAILSFPFFFPCDILPCFNSTIITHISDPCPYFVHHYVVHAVFRLLFFFSGFFACPG